MNRGYVYASLRTYENGNRNDHLRRFRGSESVSVKTRVLCLRRCA
jgi:hypothetical protein